MFFIDIEIEYTVFICFIKIGMFLQIGLKE